MVTMAVVAAAALAACSSGSGGGGAGSSDGKVTLTLWHNYGTEQNAVATQKLVSAFEAANKDITIKVVSQPADNYFSLLQASAVSKTGPDLAVMWTGLFTLKYKNLLVNLKDKVPADALERIGGLEWMSDDFNAANGPYVMPLETQFYIGFYSKKAFAKAGVDAVPTTWDELYAACGKLKDAGYTPIVYGNGGQNLGAEFYPWYDASYLTIGVTPVDKLKDLYDGQLAWNSPTMVDAYSKWAALESKGCTNPDILTKTNNMDDFIGGKAAMMIDGTWDTQKFTDAMKDDVAAFVPPFSDTPIKGVVEYPGDGFAMTSFSKNQGAAAKFLTFLTTDAAAKVINEAGLIPDIEGTSTTNPVNQQMLDFGSTGGYERYPMLDNVIQGDLADAGNKILPSILANKIKPEAGLGQMLQVWQQLSADQRGSTYQ